MACIYNMNKLLFPPFPFSVPKFSYKYAATALGQLHEVEMPKAMKLTGAPENPINGTFPSSLCLVNVNAFMT